MHKLFEVDVIICFLAAFFMLSFVVGAAISDNHQKPLTAEATITKKRSQIQAKAKVWASRSIRHGTYELSVVAGGDYDGDANQYRNGLRTQVVTARDYGTSATASAWISGHDRQGKAWLDHDYKSEPSN